MTESWCGTVNDPPLNKQSGFMFMVDGGNTTHEKEGRCCQGQGTKAKQQNMCQVCRHNTPMERQEFLRLHVSFILCFAFITLCRLGSEGVEKNAKHQQSTPA